MELVIDARRTMLSNLVDYAGLFPPASLDLPAAVDEYRAARNGPAAWLLGRFLCPTSRIEDLAAVLSTTMAAGEAPWAVGAVVDEPLGSAALHAGVFDRHMDPAARVTVVEVHTPEAAADGRTAAEAAEVMRSVVQAASGVSPQVRVLLEVARTDAWEAGITNAVAGVAELRDGMLVGLGAKLRTGGSTAEAFPSPAQVARFIWACRQHGLPFKMTAGLHHPVRHRDESLGIMRHGFLNLLAAAALAAEDAEEAEVAAAVADDDPAAFAAGPAGLRWRGRRLGAATLRLVRNELFLGYGSCSFAEPVADLRAMGILET